jgi:hypothetical protein
MGECRISWPEMAFIFGIGVMVGGLVVGTLGRKIRRYMKGRWQ